jgi:chromosomal replication initiator protein
VIDYFDAPVSAVSLAFGVPARAIESRNRRKSVALARHVVWWLCRRLPERPSFPEIGARFHVDHTSVMAGVRKVEAWSQTDTRLAARLRRLEEHLGPMQSESGRASPLWASMVAP